MAVVNRLAVSNPKSQVCLTNHPIVPQLGSYTRAMQLVPDLLSLLLKLCGHDPTRLLTADNTIESSLRTVISVKPFVFLLHSTLGA